MKFGFLVLFLMFYLVVNAQSKKEQIQILSTQVDSLINIGKKQENDILILQLELKRTKDQVEKINLENSSFQSQNSNLEIQLKDKNKEVKNLNDSLKNLIRNKLPTAETYSYSFDRLFSNKIKEHLKKLVVKYPTYPENDDRYYTKNNTTVLDTRLFLENNKMKALLITIDRVPINEDTRPQLNINFFIIDCQNINTPNVIYKWSSLLPECPVDHDNDVIDVQFSDLNNDGNVEVWIVNEKYCTGGVSLNELLVYKYEDRKHCTLESMTNSHYNMDPESNGAMDDDYIRKIYEKEPLIFNQCFSNSDPIYLNYANHLREKNIFGKSGFRFEQDGNDNSKFWSREGSQKNKIMNNEIIKNDTIQEILEKFKNNKAF